MKKYVLIVAGSILTSGFLFGLYLWVGTQRAETQVERAWANSDFEPLAEVGTTERLEVVPIYEEAGDSESYHIGHGLSYLIKTDSATVLMDVGAGPEEGVKLPAVENMSALGIPFEEIDALLFTHFHPDHTGGVDSWRQQSAYLGDVPLELAGVQAFIPSRFEVPGVSTELTVEPRILSPGMATTGAIQYMEPFPISLFDSIGAEQSLAVHVEGKGLVLIIGCGHPSVERLVERAEALFNEPVVTIIGGVHSDGEAAADIRSHIKFMLETGIKQVAISPHDSGMEALMAFREAFGADFLPIQVGQPIIIQ